MEAKKQRTENKMIKNNYETYKSVNTYTIRYFTDNRDGNTTSRYYETEKGYSDIKAVKKDAWNIKKEIIKMGTTYGTIFLDKGWKNDADGNSSKSKGYDIDGK